MKIRHPATQGDRWGQRGMDGKQTFSLCRLCFSDRIISDGEGEEKMLKTEDIRERLNGAGSPKNPAAKLNEFIGYLASNVSAGENGGVSMEEAIYAAYKSITESVIANREAQGLDAQNADLLCNNSVYGQKGNFTVGFFIRHPRDAVQYLLVQAKQKALKEEDPAKAASYDAALQAIQGKRHDYDTLVAFRSRRENDMLNLNAKYIGENGVERAFNANKAGFLDWVFRRTSRQYKNFEKAFTAYRSADRDREGMNSRDVGRAEVENSAKAYLQHKIPGYNGQGLPKLEDIERLRGKSKSRAMLCYNVIKSTKESAEFERAGAELVAATERQMSREGTNLTVDRLYHLNSIDPEEIKGALNDVSPIEKIVDITGPAQKVELTEFQINFQKSLARDLDDKQVGVNVQKMSKDMLDESVENANDMSMEIH